MKKLSAACTGMFVICTFAPASAQTDGETLLDPSLPLDYSRGRNVSVLEQPRPEYDQIGIRAGSFNILPVIDIGAGYSSNVYARSTNVESDGFAVVAPRVNVMSDWSRNQFMASASGRFRRYFSESPVNSDEWNIRGLGRLDVGSSVALTAEGQAARIQEEPFTSGTDSDIAALSRYSRVYGALRGQYQMGRVRATGSLDVTNYSFSDIETSDNMFFSQADRDRVAKRAVGQIEYALSPSFTAYGQLTYSDIDYDMPFLLNGDPNRDSHGFRGLVGVDLDLSGFMRGTVGIGYSERHFRSPFYDTAHGLSAEVQLEYFPSDLTTMTLRVGRRIEDSAIASISAFWDTGVSFRIDREIRYNILGYLEARYSNQNYVDSTRKADTYRLRGGAQYLLSPSLRMIFNTGYSKRDVNNAAPFGDVNDFRFDLTLSVRR